MGAEFQSITIERGSEDDVRVAFEKQVEEDEWEYGHRSYTGSFTEFHGLDIRPHIFNSFELAEEWLMENAEKWESALAVRFKNIKVTKRMIAHEAAIRKLYERNSNAINKVTEAKHKAMVNKRKNVPAYVTKALEQQKAVFAITEPKIAERQKAIKDIITKSASKVKKTSWLIGGWCSS